MRRIRYGVAASLDGFIAGPNGEYDWIPMDPDIDFAALLARFDAMLMGRRTYEIAGGGGSKDMEVWVFSRTLRAEEHPRVTIVSDHIDEQLNELRQRPGKDICLFGGGELFRSLLALGQVDDVDVAIVPVLLGGGIPLFPAPAERSLLELTGHRVYPRTGTVLLEYAVRRPSGGKARKPSRRGATTAQAPRRGRGKGKGTTGQARTA